MVRQSIVYSLLCAFSFVDVWCQMPVTEWANGFGGSNWDEVESVVTDQNGNVYTVGYFAETADFDPGPNEFNLTSKGSSDIFIQKSDANGNFLWARSFGSHETDQAYSVCVDDIGNVYTVGDFFGMVDFDPGPNEFNITSAGFSDAFILKLDSKGDFIWAKSCGGTFKEEAYSVKTDASNNVYIAGTFWESVDFDPGEGVFNLVSDGEEDGFIQKLDPLGNFIWAKSFGSNKRNSVSLYSMDIDPLGNIYTLGNYTGTVDFDPGANVFEITSTGGNDVFIQKINNLGDFQWVKSFGGNYHDIGYSIATDISGNVYSTGYFRDTIDLDPGENEMKFISNGGTDGYLQKLDSSGEFQWAKTFGGTSHDYGEFLTTDQNGNVYAIGHFQNTLEIELGTGIIDLTSVKYHDIFMFKLTSEGDYIWVESFGGKGFDYARAITLDQLNNIYLVGSFEKTASINIGANISDLTSEGSRDVFIHKVKECISSIVTVDNPSLPDVKGECQVLTLPYPTAKSDCGSIVIAKTTTSFPITKLGETVITWVYETNSGVSTTQIQKVIIEDNEEPIIDEVELEDVISECEVTELTPPTATDNCKSIVIGTTTEVFPLTDTKTIIWTYDDGNGNTTSQEQNVIITTPEINTDINVNILESLPVQYELTVFENEADSYQWINCETNEDVEGATSSTFTQVFAGSYKVKMTKACLEIETDCSEEIVTNLEETKSVQVTLFPNPTSGVFTMNFGDLIVNDVEVFNTSGQLMKKIKVDTEFQITNDLNLASGLYLLKVNSTVGSKIVKLSIE